MNQNIFNFIDYKEATDFLVQQLPKKGRGAYKTIAEHLRVSSVVISQVFSGQKDLTLEQGFLLAQYFSFSEQQIEYFLLLINYARSAHFSLKDYYLKRIKQAQNEAMNLRSYITEYTEIDDEAKSIFYSDWTYGAICLYVALDHINTEDDLLKLIKSNHNELSKKIIFLLKYGLIQIKDGNYQMGTRFTFLDKNSPLLNSHRKNWRIHAFSQMDQSDALFFAFPMAIPKSLSEQIKQKLLDLSAFIREEISNTEAEETICLNIDFFRF